MFTRINFENYRAFKKGSLRIAPITILVGANSIGKSSILQLLLLFKQTYEQTDFKYKAALKIHGKEVSFGNTKQLFHKQNTSEDIVVQFDFFDAELLKILQHEATTKLSDLRRDLLEVAYYYLSVGKRRLPSDSSQKLRAVFEGPNPLSQRRIVDVDEGLVSEIIKLISNTPLSNDDELSHVFLRRGLLGRNVVSQQDYEFASNFSSAVKSIKSDSFSIIYQMKYDSSSSDPIISVKKFSIISEKKIVLSIDLPTREGEEFGINTSFGGRPIPKSIKTAIRDRFSIGKSVFHFYNNNKAGKSHLSIGILSSIIERAINVMKQNFSNQSISHIGPLRAHPRRFYFLDTAQPGSFEGELLIESLREDEKLKENVNKWLKKFDVDISVSQFQEIVYKLAVKSGENPFDLDITDVGFGISQILPILVEGFLSPLGKTILVEQPEIHLHPKMQSELADLFIEIANIKNRDQQRRNIIIETHSENILNRIRSRVADGTISNTDVAIHNVEKKDGKAVIRGIYVPTNGDFEWPLEFLEADLEDIMRLVGTRN